MSHDVYVLEYTLNPSIRSLTGSLSSKRRRPSSSKPSSKPTQSPPYVCIALPDSIRFIVRVSAFTLLPTPPPSPQKKARLYRRLPASRTVDRLDWGYVKSITRRMVLHSHYICISRIPSPITVVADVQMSVHMFVF